METFKKKLDDTKAVSSGNVVRIREIEDLIVQRDALFEKENRLLQAVVELKSLYLRIKDYEFEGGSAPRDLYDDFARRLQTCEYEDEVAALKRNQILNNFETVCNDMFVKYFGQRAKMAVFDQAELEAVVKKSALRANELKMDLRSLPGQMITDQQLDEWARQRAKDAAANPRLAREPLVLVSNKQGDTLQDKSMIVTGIRKNIEQYGLKDGLKASNAALIPERLLRDGRSGTT